MFPVVYEEEGKDPIPSEIEAVLKRYGDVIPDQLHKALPPQREINH